MTISRENVVETAKNVLLDIEQGVFLKRDPVSHCKAIEDMLIAGAKEAYLYALAKSGIPQSWLLEIIGGENDGD